MRTYPNKHNLNIIKKYQHYQKLGELKKIMKLKYDHFITQLPYAIHTFHNSDVIKKRNHLNK